MLMRDSISAAGVNEMEIEANQFAAELLMPEVLLTNALGNEPFDIDNERAVSALAKNLQGQYVRYAVPAGQPFCIANQKRGDK